MKVVKIVDSSKYSQYVDIEDGSVYMIDAQQQIRRELNGVYQPEPVDVAVALDLRTLHQANIPLGRVAEIGPFGGISLDRPADIERLENGFEAVCRELGKISHQLIHLNEFIKESGH